MSKATGFLHDFRNFAIKGNAVDLAVGVIIGAAFGKIVDSIVKDLVMPIVNLILGGSVDFSNKFIVLHMPDGYTGPMTYADLTKAGANVFAWGNFITILINFILLAFIIFLMVRAIARARHEEEAAPAAPAAPAADVVLLEEIRDLLKQQNQQQVLQPPRAPGI
jgi:large conductance mechanosensitive channel